MTNPVVRGKTSASGIEKSRISRRLFMRRCVVIASGVGAASLLAACGNSSDSTSAANNSTESTSPSTGIVATSNSTSIDSATTSDSTSTADSPKRGGTLKWGFGGSIATLDPHVSSSRYDYQVENELFDQLVIRDKTGMPTPFLATKWEISADNLRYTFTLKSGVTFHDRTPFNAAAVKFNFDRMVNPDTKSEQAIYNLGPYDHTEVVDPDTATVVLKSVFAPLLIGLAEYTMGMVSPDAAQKAGKDFGQNPVGSGPFKFKEWIQNDHISLENNADYNWAPAIFEHNGPPYLDELVYQIITENATRTAALNSGQVDLIMPTPDVDVANFRSNSKYVIQSTTVQGVPPSLMFNVAKSPTDDVKVRQALSYGIDRSGINKAIYSGDQILAEGIWKESDQYYWGPPNGWYDYDPQKCEQLLDEAGWVKKSDGTRSKDGQELEVVYLTLPGQIQGIAELVQTVFQSYGVTLTIKVEDNPAQQQDAQKGIHNIVWLNWLLADPYGLDTVFGSENVGTGWNFSHFTNAQVDQWFKQGVETTDQAKRKEIYDNVQQTLYEQAVVYPINYLTRNWTYKKGIEGLIVDAAGEWAHFYDTWISK